MRRTLINSEREAEEKDLQSPEKMHVHDIGWVTLRGTQYFASFLPSRTRKREAQGSRRHGPAAALLGIF